MTICPRCALLYVARVHPLCCSQQPGLLRVNCEIDLYYAVKSQSPLFFVVVLPPFLFCVLKLCSYVQCAKVASDLSRRLPPPISILTTRPPVLLCFLLVTGGNRHAIVVRRQHRLCHRYPGSDRPRAADDLRLLLLLPAPQG